jgi:hypothetical protein
VAGRALAGQATSLGNKDVIPHLPSRRPPSGFQSAGAGEGYVFPLWSLNGPFLRAERELAPVGVVVGAGGSEPPTSSTSRMGSGVQRRSGLVGHPKRRVG